MNDRRIILHSHPASPYCRKVRVALGFHGLNYDDRRVDVTTDFLHSEEFLEISPFGKMPALELGPTPYYESTSIIELLEEIVGGGFLLDPAREARHFDRLGDLYLLDPQTMIWFGPDSPEAEAAIGTVRTAWGVLEARLRDGPFLGGDRFSFADLSSAIGTDHLIFLGLDPPKSVGQWLDRCYESPCMAADRQESHEYLTQMLRARDERRH